MPRTPGTAHAGAARSRQPASEPNQSTAPTGAATNRPPPGVLGAGALRPLGVALSAVYSVGVRRDARRFDKGKGVHTLDRPVISIGNLSVGGTGKTPTVAYLARWLLAQGHRPAIAMRGYKAPKHGQSDEARVYQEMLAGHTPVPVVAQPDRAAGLRALFATPHGRRVSCVLLDDGFQHRRLARCLDLVLIDATRSPFQDRLLPAGWLREPTDRLARAGTLVITHANRVTAERLAELEQQLTRVAPHAAVAHAVHAWDGLTLHAPDGAATRKRLEAIKGQRVVAVCGIGNPEPFFTAVQAHARSPITRFTLPDHARFDAPAVARITRAITRDHASLVVTTLKDWVKLRHADRAGWPPVAVPDLTLRVQHGEPALHQAIAEALGPPTA